MATNEEGNPGRTPEDELDDRVSMAIKLISQGLYKSDIKKALQVRYGVSARTVENYLARAREMLLTDMRVGQDELRSESMAFYRGLIANADVPPMTRLKAQERIDKLLGLDAPTKVAQTDTDGNNLPPESRRAELSGLLAELRDRSGSELDPATPQGIAGRGGEEGSGTGPAAG